jgi:hypothetical protein
MAVEGIRCVVGIDLAKRAQVVCALAAPTGQVRQRPKAIAATADGYAQPVTRLRAWGTRADAGAAGEDRSQRTELGRW